MILVLLALLEDSLLKPQQQIASLAWKTQSVWVEIQSRLILDSGDITGLLNLFSLAITLMLVPVESTQI